MLTPDPVARITVLQIKQHPWVNINGNAVEQVMCHSKEISEKIVEQCLEIPQFSSFSKLHAIELIRSNQENNLTVSYKILQNIDRNNRNSIGIPRHTFVLERKNNTKNCKELNGTHVVTNNWAYGFRCNFQARGLMEKLFAALKDSGLEWKFFENFSIRVRAVENIMLKFDIKVYKVITT